ncbi:hypothetical protein ABPG72_012167 [Tetrahymena utriculariae]
MSKTIIIALIATLVATGTLFAFQLNSTSNYLQKNSKVSGGADVQGSYTYFAFEREWPGTVCKVNKCTPQDMGNFDSKNFNLHGLWPSGLESNQCSYPQDCGNTHFSFSNISQPTKTYMNTYWVGLYSSTQTFLDHEWTKHGTCYGNDQNQYFTVATDLHKKYNPISALAAKNIVPSDSKSYTVQQVQSALESGFGGPVFLQCKKVNGQQMLFAVDMYFNKALTGVISQPCTKQSSCSTSQPIYLPTV